MFVVVSFTILKMELVRIPKRRDRLRKVWGFTKAVILKTVPEAKDF